MSHADIRRSGRLEGPGAGTGLAALCLTVACLTGPGLAATARMTYQASVGELLTAVEALCPALQVPSAAGPLVVLPQQPDVVLCRATPTSAAQRRPGSAAPLSMTTRVEAVDGGGTVVSISVSGGQGEPERERLAQALTAGLDRQFQRSSP